MYKVVLFLLTAQDSCPVLRNEDTWTKMLSRKSAFVGDNVNEPQESDKDRPPPLLEITLLRAIPVLVKGSGNLK